MAKYGRVGINFHIHFITVAADPPCPVTTPPRSTQITIREQLRCHLRARKVSNGYQFITKRPMYFEVYQE
jgi:hypothetical protein